MFHNRWIFLLYISVAQCYTAVKGQLLIQAAVPKNGKDIVVRDTISWRDSKVYHYLCDILPGWSHDDGNQISIVMNYWSWSILRGRTLIWWSCSWSWFCCESHKSIGIHIAVHHQAECVPILQSFFCEPHFYLSFIESHASALERSRIRKLTNILKYVKRLLFA